MLLPAVFALDGHGLRRKHIHVQIDEREREPVDQAALGTGRTKPLSVSVFVTCSWYCTSMSNVPLSCGEQLLRRAWSCGRLR